ncbi:MAG: hypothetical protein JWN44_4098 [Myxococcales bacterium]|nr:hypothetical protein [Myxococcales bacterium]
MARPPAFPTAQVVRILILAVLLGAVIVMKARCGTAAEQMFKAFDVPRGDGGAHD